MSSNCRSWISSSESTASFVLTVIFVPILYLVIFLSLVQELPLQLLQLETSILPNFVNSSRHFRFHSKISFLLFLNSNIAVHSRNINPRPTKYTEQACIYSLCYCKLLFLLFFLCCSESGWEVMEVKDMQERDTEPEVKVSCCSRTIF